MCGTWSRVVVLGRFSMGGTDAAAAAVSPAEELVLRLAEACWSQDPDARPRHGRGGRPPRCNRAGARAQHRPVARDQAPVRGPRHCGPGGGGRLGSGCGASSGGRGCRLRRSSGRDGCGGDWGGGLVGLVGVIDLDDQLSTGMQTAVGDSEPGALLAVENEQQRGVFVEQQRVQLWQPQAATRGG